MELQLGTEDMSGWPVEVLRFRNEARSMAVTVLGPVGNSITTSKLGAARTARWKVSVGSAVKAARGPEPWSPRLWYALTVGLRFHPQLHGSQSLDVENFLKPTLDAVAAGLFCESALSLETLNRWGFDDSNFAHILAHKLESAAAAEDEGLRLFVSARV